MAVDQIARGLAASTKAAQSGPSGRTTIVERLRRVASKAERDNPVLNAPLLAPDAYANSTAYIAGQVISTSAGLYNCLISGTTSGSGTGPSATGSSTAIVDGTAQFLYLSGPQRTTSSQDAPAVTVSTAPIVGTGTFISYLDNPTKFSIRGATAVSQSGGVYYKLKTYDASPTAIYENSGYVEFFTDAPIMSLGFINSGPPMRVEVDGKFVTYGNVVLSSGGSTPNYLNLDFTASSGRRARRIRVKFQSFSTFCGVSVGPTSSVWAAPAVDDVKAAFISDSIYAGSGYGPNIAGNLVPHQVGDLLGWSDVWSFSTGGTGYIATGSGTGSPFYTYRQRVSQALSITPDIWVLFGSTNDIGSTTAAITVEALLTLQTIRAGSSAPIIVFGIYPAGSPATYTSRETAIAAAVTAFGDARTYFIPVCTDADGSWFNSSNAVQYVGGDGLHPIDAGSVYLAHRQARAIKQLVLPYLN